MVIIMMPVGFVTDFGVGDNDGNNGVCDEVLCW